MNHTNNQLSAVIAILSDCVMPFCTFSVEPLKNQESAVMISDRFDLKPEEASYIIDAIAEDGDVGYFEVIGGGEVALGYIIVVVDSRGLVKRCYY